MTAMALAPVQTHVELPFLINDADNHFVEPRDLYVNHVDPKWRHKAVTFEADEQGRWVGVFGGRPSRIDQAVAMVAADDKTAAEVAARAVPQAGDENQMKPGQSNIHSPGMLLSRLNPYRNLTDAERVDLIAYFRDQEESWGNRDLRLALMDSQGIGAALMFPNQVLSLEYEFADDVDGIYANTRAYNRWINEEIGWGYLNRLFLPAYVSLADPDEAAAEVELVLSQGATVIQIISGHVHGGRHDTRGGRSMADPIYDGFWARINEAGARVVTHLGATDYQKYGADWSEDPEDVLGDFDALQWVLYWGDRPAMETVAAMVLHNLFGRFPNLKVCLSEQGTVWLPYILRKMDHAYLMGRGAKWGPKLNRRPSDIFRDHFIVAPFPEENVARVVEAVGIEPIVFGSDFPHSEGLPFPALYATTQLKGMSDADVKTIMCDNLARFLNIEPVPTGAGS